MVGNLNNSGLYKSDEKEERNINTPLRSDAFNLNEEEKAPRVTSGAVIIKPTNRSNNNVTNASDEILPGTIAHKQR
mgnify:CR=1 FL=1